MSDERSPLIDPASGASILPLRAGGTFPGGTPWGIADHGDNVRIAIGRKQLDCSTTTEARIYRDFARALYKIVEGHWPEDYPERPNLNWITNIYEQDKLLKDNDDFLRGKVFGAPKSTDTFTATELRNAGMIGVYEPGRGAP